MIENPADVWFNNNFELKVGRGFVGNYAKANLL